MKDKKVKIFEIPNHRGLLGLKIGEKVYVGGYIPVMSLFINMILTKNKNSF